MHNNAAKRETGQGRTKYGGNNLARSAKNLGKSISKILPSENPG